MLLFITCLGLSIKSIYTQLKILTVFEERGLHENALFFFSPFFSPLCPEYFTGVALLLVSVPPQW